jgi:hypothetical protein
MTCDLARFAMNRAQPEESFADRLDGEAATPTALEVPDIVGAGTYKTCGSGDDPVILRP